MKKIYLSFLVACIGAFSPVDGQTDPEASFDYSFLNGLACETSTIQFQNTSFSLSGGLVLTIWDFGDGESSAVFNPTHAYTQAGNYTVTLTVYNEDGDFEVATEMLVINPLPQVNFQIDAGVTNHCESTEQVFDNLSAVAGDALTYQWNFGDGAVSSIAEPSHSYALPQEYQVSLRATATMTGCVDSLTSTVTVHPEAVVNFSFDNQCNGVPIEFANLTTVAFGNTTFLWDFDDGNTSVLENPSHLYGLPGAYDVTLTVTTEEGCQTNLTQTVTVYEQPVADFQVDNVCDEVAAQFDNSSTSSDTFLWYFGDGATSADENPNHLYAEPGDYIVALVSTHDDGCQDSITQTLTVYPLPQTEFTVEDVCFGTSAAFENNSQIISGTISSLWDFDDGNSSVEVSPNYLYENPGAYDVRLTATSMNGCVTFAEVALTIHDQPVASFSVDDICADTLAIFQNLTTTEVDTTSLSYSWDFGDNQSSTTGAPTHQYTATGTYDVAFSVVTNQGCSDAYNDKVTVKPMPDIKFVYDNVCDTITVPFINLSSIVSGTLTYNWDFGDGRGSSEKEPTHLFPTSGTYDIQLTGTSEFGCDTSLTKPIVIYPRPVSDFTVAPVCDGSTSLFSNTSLLASGDIEDYTWNFGDGTTSIVEHPSKAYLNEGTYEVSLEVVSDFGCEDLVRKEAIVYEFPIANFTVDNVCNGFPVTPGNLSSISSNDLRFEWDFGDDNFSREVAPVHIYDAPGLYTITLKSTSSTGCFDVIQKDVVIYDFPNVEAGRDTLLSQGFSVRLQATGGVDYVWSPVIGLDNSNIPDPIATPLQTTTYQVLVTDEFGCQNTDSVTIQVEEDFKLIANNVFTPDGNGQNDTWIVQNVETFGTVNVRVYDRYGTLVFQDEAYQNDWRGTFGNDILPDGNYFYLITFSDSPVEYQGAITLIRNR